MEYTKRNDSNKNEVLGQHDMHGELDGLHENEVMEEDYVYK